MPPRRISAKEVSSQAYPPHFFADVSMIAGGQEADRNELFAMAQGRRSSDGLAKVGLTVDPCKE